MACAPDTDGAVLHITSIDLSAGGLRGVLPAEIGELRQLTRLNLSSNLLYGGAPATLPYARYVRLPPTPKPYPYPYPYP